MVAHDDTLARRLNEIERQIRDLATSRRASNTTITDDDGNELVRLSRDGLTITDGAIWVGGGPVRAIDIAFNEAQDYNVSLTTTMTKHGVVVVTPPDWATTVVAQAFCLFQMSNTSGAKQGMLFRATVNDVPASGGYTNDVGATEVENVTDYFQRTLTRGIDFTTSFELAGYMGVVTGTNSANIIQTKATVYYLR